MTSIPETRGLLTDFCREIVILQSAMAISWSRQIQDSHEPL